MKKTIIIAEAGVNHNGDLKIAKKLVDVAVKAKVDYIKFQTFKTENIVTKNSIKSDYQNINSPESSNQYDMLKKLEMSDSMHKKLINYCRSKKIKFLSTPFDIESIEYLKKTGLKLIKIPSGEITNLPYLKKIAELFNKVIMSTGMSNINEIRNAYNVLIENGLDKNNIYILHCNTDYPTKMKDVNLHAMLHIGNEIDVKIGYSDHTLGIEVPIAAVSLGAKVIEKHFTLNRNLPGPDHKASLEPNELEKMVDSIRNVELALKGSGFKTPTKSELKNIKTIRKSLYFKRDMKKGDKIIETDLTTMRPATGIDPMQINKVLNKILKNDIKHGKPLKWKHIK
jgi:N,N'-diacetyllegionaminate synthase